MISLQQISSKGRVVLVVASVYFLFCQGLPQAIAQKKISVLIHSCAQTTETRKLLDDFHKKYPEIKVNWEELGSGEMRRKETLELVAGTGAYDVMNISPFSADQFMESGFLTNLESFFASADPEVIKKENFVEALHYTARNPQTGEWYGVPWRSDFYLLHYNAKAFEEAGIPEPVEYDDTWDYRGKFLEVAEKLTVGDQYGYLFIGSRTYGWCVNIFRHLLWCDGGELFDENWNPQFNSDIGVNALQFALDLIYKYEVTSPNVGAYTHIETNSVFQQGKAAMFGQWPYTWTEANKLEVSKIAGYAKTALVPKGKVTRKYAYGCQTLAIPESAKEENKEAAWKFIVWATSAEIEKKVIMNGGDTNGARKETFQDEELLEKFPILKTILRTAEFSIPGPLIAEYTELSHDGLAMNVNKALIRQVSPKEALDAAAKRAIELFKKTGRIK